MTFIVACLAVWIWSCSCMWIGYVLGTRYECNRWKEMAQRALLKRQREEIEKGNVPVIIKHEQNTQWN